MFARFDKNPAMTLQDVKETKRNVTDARTDNVKTVYPPQTKFVRGIMTGHIIESSSFEKNIVNPITVGNFAFLFNCTPVGWTSDSMMVPT